MDRGWLNLSSLRQRIFITGTFKAPKAQGPDGLGRHRRFTCPTAILQTGIYITYSKVVTKYVGMVIRIFKRLRTLPMSIVH